MLTVKVSVTADCEALLHALPRFQGWYLEDERYDEDGAGVVTICSYDLDGDLPASTERAISLHPGVVEFEVL